MSYGSEKHGYSLNTLYRNVQQVKSPVLLVMKSAAQEVLLLIRHRSFGSVINPFNSSDVKWLRFRVLRAILV